MTMGSLIRRRKNNHDTRFNYRLKGKAVTMGK